jgi:RNA polymerase sigma factor (sigma-70 family)
VDRPESEAELIALLPRIDRMVTVLARRNGFRGPDVADLNQWVNLRLLENDYSVVKKFRGESSIGTFLHRVVSRLVQDYRIQRFGRWRPSAAAIRLGHVAVRLESLVYRRGYTFAEACEVLRSSADTQRTDRELAAMFIQLPRRTSVLSREAGEGPLATVESTCEANDLVDYSEDAGERSRIQSALRRALDDLPDEDRCLIMLYYWQDMSVADIGRFLNVESKPLFRKIHRAELELRRALERAGVSSLDARALIDEAAQ